jgi:LDH2 family malate/lactate/ureidoglycolate dehydrogenase|tara:strand:- start:4023 stop:5123 length:1101 start_codon:yes stop_codon:yes gene_type:complete
LLEQFKVKDADAIFVEEAPLRETVTAIFKKMGVTDADAVLGADVLVTADMRGVDTHGVSNMLRGYVAGYTGGSLNPRPNWRIVRETPATANIDSDTGLGIMVVPKAMDIAIEKAKNTGVGMVTISNGRHLGMASYHAMMALEHDMIGTCMTSCPPSVLPTWGAEPRLGTNPIAVAAPADKEPAFVFDAATSTVAGNKLGLARRLDNNLLPGWVADVDGVPIMEEAAPPAPGYEGPATSFLLPLGSTRELGSHKGYGMGMIVDVLGGILSGGGYGMNPGRPNFGHYVAAYSIEAFMDVGEFKRTMDDMLQGLRTTPPAKGHDRVMYPGLPESESEVERATKGIPFHPEVIDWFKDICGELSLPYELS